MKIAICFGLVVSAAAFPGEFFAAQAQQPPLQSPNMTFFMTGFGPGKGGDLGGIEGANRHCQELAQRAGAGNKTWRAYLSTQATEGKLSRKTSTIFIATITNLVDREERNDPRLGYAPNRHDVLTGSQELAQRAGAARWPRFPGWRRSDLQQLDQQHPKIGDGRAHRPEGPAR
jgi:hypothetical protein